MIEQLDRIIADLEAESGTITERLRLAPELRATYDPPADDRIAPAPTTTAKKKPTKQTAARRARDRERKRKQRAKRTDDRPKTYTCPDCGEAFASPQGVGAHRRHQHPGSAAQPVKPLPPVSTTPTFKDRVFRCDDGQEFPNIPALTRHTVDAHRRPPTPVERTPVEPKREAAA